MTNDNDLIIEKVKQNEILGNIGDEFETLEKVKKLILYKGMKMKVTAQQVADYYDVSKMQIGRIINVVEDELISDGSRINLNGKELKTFKESYKLKISKSDESHESYSSDNPFLRINSLTLLTFRSVIRIGMMLEKSEVAKKLRNVLLDNLQEDSTKASIKMSIDEEQRLQLAIFSAKTSEEAVLAMTKLNRFKDRHIEKLEENNIELIEQNKTWENLLGKQNTYNFNQLTKFLSSEYKLLPNGKNMGRNNLFNWLREEKILRKNNEPYQSVSHHFKIFPHDYGFTTVIYSNSIEWLIKRIDKKLKENNIEGKK